MKKILLYGVLPLSLIATGYVLWRHKKPDITSVDFTGVESKRYVTIVVDKQEYQIKAGECLAIRGYSICLEDKTFFVSLKKNGAIIKSYDYVPN